jgi:two-component system heavy metal sensor histidine kinase CusS
MRRLLGLRGRLIAATTVLTLATLGVAFGVVYAVVNREQQHQLDDALRHEAALEAQEISRFGPNAIVISDRPGPDVNDVGPLPKYAAVYRSGTLVTATPNFAARAAHLGALHRRLGLGFDLWIDSEHLRAIRVDIPAHPDTTLFLAVPRKDLDGDAAFLRRAMLLVLLVALAWTVVLTSGIVLRLTRTQQRIIQVVRRVSVGDLGARVAAGTAGDDLTELGRNVDEMIQRLSVLMRSQQQFIANAAHELRSPLTVLYGELSLALRRSRSSEDYRRTIEEALSSTRQLKTLAEDLLALARLGAAPTPATEEASLASVLAEAAQAAEADRVSREVGLRFESVDLPVRGRTADLVRLFRNLLENAIRHAPERSAVEVSARTENDTVQVMVRDFGDGVPSEDRERIFEPFFRSSRDRATDQPGAGLGLPIARNIARLHGGELELGPSNGAPGSQFIVTLPAGQRGPGEKQQSA